MENTRLVLTENAIKRHSKRLQHFLKTLHIDYSLTQAQNAFATILGMDDYHALHQLLKSESNNKVSDINNVMSKHIKYIKENFSQHILQGSQTVDVFLDFIATVPGDTFFHINSNLPTTFSLADTTEIHAIENSIISLGAIELLLDKLSSIALSELQTSGYISIAYKYKQAKLIINATSEIGSGSHRISLTIKKCSDDLFDMADIVHKNLLTHRNILQPKQGLIIIAGPVGSGKNTLLKSIIQKSVYEKKQKLITYESPIEYTYDTIGTQSVVTQNEIPTGKFSQKIEQALRRKPSIISVGEIHDMDAIKEVVYCSMTGHAVYTSINSSSIIETIKKLINIMPIHDRYNHANDIISTLNTIVCSKTVMGTNGNVVFLQEYLHFTSDMKEKLIESLGVDGDISQLLKLVQQYILTDGCSLNKAIIEAYDKNLITIETLNSLIFNNK